MVRLLFCLIKRQQKNTCSKISHMLLFQEQFKYLKTTNSKRLKNKKLIDTILEITIFLSLFFGVYIYPIHTYFIIIMILIIINSVNLFKNKTFLKYLLLFFLLVYCPFSFYFCLGEFVKSVIAEGLLLETYDSPIVVKMDFQSFSFWVLRFFAIHTIKFPLLNLEINSIFLRKFVIETYYLVVCFCELTGLNFNCQIKV